MSFSIFDDTLIISLYDTFNVLSLYDNILLINDNKYDINYNNIKNIIIEGLNIKCVLNDLVIYNLNYDINISVIELNIVNASINHNNFEIIKSFITNLQFI